MTKPRKKKRTTVRRAIVDALTEKNGEGKTASSRVTALEMRLARVDLDLHDGHVCTVALGARVKTLEQAELDRRIKEQEAEALRKAAAKEPLRPEEARFVAVTGHERPSGIPSVDQALADATAAPHVHTLNCIYGADIVFRSREAYEKAGQHFGGSFLQAGGSRVAWTQDGFFGMMRVYAAFRSQVQSALSSAMVAVKEWGP
jgi:hypothetical protein